jgi:hypothetical protein
MKQAALIRRGFLLASNRESGRAESGEAADANGDGAADVTGAVAILSYLFLAGEAPPPPFPGCGFPGGAAPDSPIGRAARRHGGEHRLHFSLGCAGLHRSGGSMIHFPGISKFCRDNVAADNPDLYRHVIFRRGGWHKLFEAPRKVC